MQRFSWMAVGATVLVAVVTTVALDAQKGGGGTKLTATELRTTFADAGGDAIRSDGGFYETSSVEKTSNTLTATTAANYMLDAFTANKGTPVRCLVVEPAHVVAQRAGETMPSFGCLVAEITSLSFFRDSTDSLRGMDSVVNSYVVKRVAIGWQEGGYQYHLRFKGESVDLGDGTGAHRLANVGFACTASSGVGCLAWTAAPARCEVAATGGPYSSVTNCDPADGKFDHLAVLERKSAKGSSTPVMIAVVEVPFLAQVDRRN